MFENIVGQEDIVEQLREDVEAGRLPQAILFSGPEYSGKLSTALELARVMSCTGGGGWSCRCRSCELNRELLHPRVVLAGSRYFVQEILACGETLKGAPGRGTAYLYLRAVRKLLRRIDPVMWEGEENRLSKALEALSETETALEPVVAIATGERETGELDHAALAEAVDGSRIEALKVLKAMPADLVPVSAVRRLTASLHDRADGRRVVIVENVDHLGDASINALLKVLEEPPPESTFILSSARKGAVLPTIRSRVRDYRFRERSQVEASEVIRRVFRGPEGYSRGIREYFLEQEFPGAGSLRGHAERFLEAVVSARATSGSAASGASGVQAGHAQVAQALSEVPEREALRHFLQELLSLLGEVLRAEEGTGRFAISTARISRWRALVQEQYERSSRLNMRMDLLLHTLEYRMSHE